MFPTWPKMAKTAKYGRNGPHLRCLISKTMASNNLAKTAIDTYEMGPNICPIPALKVAAKKTFPLAKNGTGKMAGSNIPHYGSPMDLPSQSEDTWGHSLFEAGACTLSKSPLTLHTGRTQPQG